MKYKLLRFVFGVFLTVGPVWQAIAEDVGIRAPDGFKVSLYAGDALAHDIHSMTIDSHGRVVVAGKGYVKILHDTGLLDTAKDRELADLYAYLHTLR